MTKQSDTATIAFAIAGGVAAIMTLVYTFFAGWPRGAGKSHIPIWSAFAAFTLAFVTCGLLVDVGGTLRNDHVEYNYARWVGYTAAYVLLSFIISSWQWFDTLDGSKLIVFAFITGTLTTLTGLTTADRRWPVFAVSVVFAVVWIIWVFWKPNYRSYDKSIRSNSSKFWSTLFSIVLSLTIGLNLCIFFFGSTFLGDMSFVLEVWIYACTVIILSVLPIIAVLDYNPEPSEKME